MKRGPILFSVFISVFLLLTANCGGPTPPTGVDHWAQSYHYNDNTWSTTVLSTGNEFFVAGNIGEAGGMSSKFLLLKLDPNGKVQWNKTYSHNAYRQAGDMQKVVDKNGKTFYFVTGYTFEKGVRSTFVMKLDETGGVNKERVYYDSTYHNQPSALSGTHDGGIIIAGQVENLQTKNQDFWVMKLNADLGIEWQKKYDYLYDPDGKGVRPANETGISIIEKKKGGYFAVGNILTPEYGYDPWILDIESDLKLKTDKRLKSSGDNNQVTSMVQHPADDNIAVSGFTNSDGDGTLNVFVLMFEVADTAKLKWSKAYNHIGPDYSYSIDQTSKKDLVLAGSGITSVTNSLDALIYRIEPGSGSIKWAIAYADIKGGQPFNEGFYSLQVSDHDDIAVSGYTNSFPNSGFKNSWVMNLNDLGKIDETKYDLSCMLLELNVSPYVPDWTFGCLPGYQPIDVQNTHFIPRTITSNVDSIAIKSMVLCP